MRKITKASELAIVGGGYGWVGAQPPANATSWSGWYYVPGGDGSLGGEVWGSQVKVYADNGSYTWTPTPTSE